MALLYRPLDAARAHCVLYYIAMFSYHIMTLQLYYGGAGEGGGSPVPAPSRVWCWVVIIITGNW